MNSVVASTLPFLNSSFTGALKRISELGFEGVEIYYEGRHNLPKKKVLDDLSIYDFRVFLHAPFSDLNIASFNKTVLSESKKQIKSSLEIAFEIGAVSTTVHFGRYSPLGLSYPNAAIKKNRESVAEISSFAEDLSVEIAFENTPSGFGAMYGPLDSIESFIVESGVKITLDIGHANTWKESPTEFINRLNSSIAHIHLHDNTGESDMHMTLGNGTVDYEGVFMALKKINYKKALCLEMLYEEDLKQSKEKINSIIGD